MLELATEIGLQMSMMPDWVFNICALTGVELRFDDLTHHWIIHCNRCGRELASISYPSVSGHTQMQYLTNITIVYRSHLELRHAQ